MLLSTTSQSFELVLAAPVATTALPYTVGYTSNTSTTFTPAASNGTSNNTTHVTVVSAPAASTQVQIKHISVYNLDTASATIIFKVNDGGTRRYVYSATIGVSEQLVFADGRWFLYDANGVEKDYDDGDVAGPASAVAGNVATFLGTTGKAIQDSLIPATGLTLTDGSREFYNPIGGRNPANHNQLATKQYVDTGAGGAAFAGSTGHFLMVHTDGNVSNGRAITFAPDEFIVADGGAGGQYTVAVRESQIPHNNLAGLTTGDPHTQYSLVAGTRAFSAVVAGVDPANLADLSTKRYVDTGAATLSGHYLMVHTDGQLPNERAITMASDGFIVADGGAGGQYAISIRHSQTPHGSLDGLTSGDPHTQYSLVAGTRAFSAVVAGVDPADLAHLATKRYVDTGGSFAGSTGHFLVVHSDANLTNERALTFNHEFTVSDGGAGGQYLIGVRESQIPHNNLPGLTSGDPHTQYMPTDGSRDFSNYVNGVSPADKNHLATKSFMDTGSPEGTGLYLLIEQHESRMPFGRVLSFNSSYFIVTDNGIQSTYAVTLSPSSIVSVEHLKRLSWLSL